MADETIISYGERGLGDLQATTLADGIRIIAGNPGEQGESEISYPAALEFAEWVMAQAIARGAR